MDKFSTFPALFNDLHNKLTTVIWSFQTTMACHIIVQKTLKVTWGDLQARTSGDLSAVIPVDTSLDGHSKATKPASAESYNMHVAYVEGD